MLSMITGLKEGEGSRQFGIPTALDRFIQQAIVQVLQPRFDPTFSEHSYGFRPGRSAQQALAEAQRYVEEGRRYVVHGSTRSPEQAAIEQEMVPTMDHSTVGQIVHAADLQPHRFR